MKLSGYKGTLTFRGRSFVELGRFAFEREKEQDAISIEAELRSVDRFLAARFVHSTDEVELSLDVLKTRRLRVLSFSFDDRTVRVEALWKPVEASQKGTGTHG